MPERARSYSAGRFTLHTTTTDAGTLLLSVAYVTPGGAVQTIAHLTGYPNAGPGDVLLNVADAYDSSNRLAIAPGGGTPTPVLDGIARRAAARREAAPVTPNPYDRMARRAEQRAGDRSAAELRPFARPAPEARPRCPRCYGPLAEVPGRPPYCPESACANARPPECEECGAVLGVPARYCGPRCAAAALATGAPV